MNRLHQQLHAFAAHLRDPQAAPPPPDIEDRRMAVYRDLFLNNIRGLLATNFPVIRATLGEDRWLALVRDFHARHRSHTPLFTEIGQEFVAFLQQRPGDGEDAPWLAELAHYEWVELALQLADETLPPHDPQGSLLDGQPLVSPYAWPLAYGYPVHRIGPGFQAVADADRPTLLLARRRDDGSVHFAELSPLVYRLLELLEEAAGHSGRDALSLLADEARAADRAAFFDEGTSMLQRLRAEGTLLGTRR